jgi:hypothetical protein
MISPLIKWNHKENFYVLKYNERIETNMSFNINLQDREYEFITGHEIDRKF